MESVPTRVRVVTLALVSGLAGCSVAPAASGDAAGAGDAAADAADVAQEHPGVRQVSDGGTYVAWLDGLQGGVVLGQGGAATLVLRLAATGDVAPGVTATLAFTHVGMGHGGVTPPTLTDNGDGSYAIAGLTPSMSGDWELALDVADGARSESISFVVAAAK